MFEFKPDQTTDYGVTCPRAFEKSMYNVVNTLGPSFLAHLSRRLIGELIVYPWSGVRCPSASVHNAQTSSSQKPLG